MRRHGITVGIIGMGYITARCHLPALARVKGLRLVAVADPRPERLALAPRARRSARWEEVVGAPDVDAIIVATPSDSHATIGLAVLGAGKHLLLEKPIALNGADGARLLAAEAASSRVAAPGLFLRHLNLIEELKTLIPRIGEPLSGLSAFHNHVARRHTVTGYERHRSSGGGVLFDLAYHHFDLYASLLGSSIAAVECRAQTRHTDDDLAQTRVRLSSGLTILGSFCSATYNENRIVLYGTEGRIIADAYRAMRPRFRSTAESHPARLRREVGDGLAALRVGANMFPPVRLQPFITQLERFRDAMLGRSVPLPRMIDGLSALRAVEAAYASSAHGGEIPL